MARTPNTKRRAEIIRLREREGKTFAEIGQIFHVTRQTIQETYASAKRDKERVSGYPQART